MKSDRISRWQPGSNSLGAVLADVLLTLVIMDRFFLRGSPNPFVVPERKAHVLTVHGWTGTRSDGFGEPRKTPKPRVIV